MIGCASSMLGGTLLILSGSGSVVIWFHFTVSPTNMKSGPNNDRAVTLYSIYCLLFV